MFITENQAIQAITGLLRARGYDPAQYDLLAICEAYRHETGGYDNIQDHQHIVWLYVDDHKMA